MALIPRRPESFDPGEERLVFAEPPSDHDEALLLGTAGGGAVAEVSAVATATAPRRSTLATLFWSSLGGLVSLGVGLGIAGIVDELFARAPWLGWVGIALAAIFALSCLVLLGREMLAVRRLGRIDDLRARAEAVLLSDDRAAGLRVLDEMNTLYAGEPRTARGRARLGEVRREIIDGADLIRLAEAEVLTALDAEARLLVAGAAKRVSVVTAVAPRAVIDIAVVAAVAVRLIRQIATVYGARPGTFGFLRLLRHVLAHLAVTGGMAAGEGMLDQIVGHGIAAKLSARLGEGVINGILTARIGLAAIAVCRPLPFEARRAPTLREVAGGLFEGKGRAGSASAV